MMILPVEESAMLTTLSKGQKRNGFEIAENRQISSNAWFTVHELVVRGPSGAFYRTTYQRATEPREQDSYPPFGLADKPVEWRQVLQRPVTTYEYEDAAA